jgi:hypothetical protein
LLQQDGNRDQNQIDIPTMRAVIVDLLDENDLRASIASYEQVFDKQRTRFNSVLSNARAQFQNIESEMAATVAGAKKDREVLLEQGKLYRTRWRRNSQS